MSNQIYKNLVVWQQAMDLAVETYRLIKFLPESEKNTLSDQMRRTSIDIPAKIAEGHEVVYEEDCAECLSLAHSSQCELEMQIILCIRLGYFSDYEAKAALNLCREISKKLVSIMEELEDDE